MENIQLKTQSLIEYSDGKEKESEKICPICGEKFICYNSTLWAYKRYYYKSRKSHTAVPMYFCSWHCLRENDAERKEKLVTRTCKQCGQTFTSRGVPGHPKIYCDECTEERKKARDRERQRKRAKNAKR